MNVVGFALLLAIAGTFIGALYTFVVGLGGSPGAMLTHLAMRRTKTNLIPTWGLVLTVLGQSYVALAFVVFVVLITKNHLNGLSGPGAWIAWVIAFYVATLPAWAALKDSARSENKNVQHGASIFTAMLSVLGFFVFVFIPSLVRPLWSWITPIALAFTSTLASCSGESMPAEHQRDRDNLSSAFTAFNRVSELTSPPDGQVSFEATAQLYTQVIESLRQGLASGDSVSRDFLDWLHPDMNNQFRNNYLAGHKLYLDGLVEDDPAKKISGVQSVQRWYNGFWSVHKETITSKAFD